MKNCFTSGQAIQAVSVSCTKQFGAIACGSYVQVLRIDGDELLSQCNLESNSSGRSTFTTSDVAWNFYHPERLAASATNGSVVVFHVDCSSSGAANKSSRKWESVDEASRAVHKVSWHPQEHSLLASACQDGTVKIFDVRQQAQAQTFSSRADATRDVQFDPFHSHIVAAVFENGSLCLWDRRKPPSEDKAQTTWLKIAAHTNSSLAIAWCPTREWVLATGSRDRTVKVWDFSGCSTGVCLTDGDESSHSTSASVYNSLPASGGIAIGTGATQKPAYVLHTPTAVGRIAWRPSSTDDGKLQRQQLQLATSSPDRGEISVWDVNMPNIPVCILKGHSSEACTGISWLDTPSSSSSKRDSSVETKVTKSSFIQRKDPAPPPPPPQAWMRVHQHILSTGKDGRLLVQDLRNGTFPRQHIARSVATISSRGHVAYQRGEVSRADQVGLTVSTLTAAAPGLYADDPLLFGMPLGEIATTSSDQGPVATGHVFVGLADIAVLEVAGGIRSERGAEAGVFDPALMKLLAKSYSLGEPEGAPSSSSASSVGSASSLSDVAKACRKNLEAASSAGLTCRSAVWATVLTLLPLPQPSPAPSIFSASSSSAVTTKRADSVGVDSLQVAFASDLLGSILSELLEGGDCQHFTILCELLRRAGMLEAATLAGGISKARLREAYLSYLETLNKLQLFFAANSIISVSEEDYISKMNLQGVSMHTACSRCGMELPEQVSSPWCTRCKRCAGMCSVCRRPVKGLLHWCPVCGHGGHLACHKAWFSQHATCPTGCGHDCCSTMITDK